MIAFMITNIYVVLELDGNDFWALPKLLAKFFWNIFFWKLELREFYLENNSIRAIMIPIYVVLEINSIL